MILLNRLIQFNSLTILGVFRSEEEVKYMILNVKRKKNILKIVSFSKHYDLDTALKAADRKKPVVLLIDGKGVLNKKIDPDKEIDVSWKKNIDFNTIYYTEYKNEKYSFLSFCRKQQVDNLIANLQAEKIMIIDLYIGPLLSALLYSAINKNSIISNDTILEFEDGSLADIKKGKETSKKVYNFNDLNLPHEYLGMYGTALHYYLRQENISKSGHLLINREGIVYKKAFETLGMGMLVTFFLALLVNYFVIQHYSGLNTKINQKNIFANQTYQSIIELEKQKEQKTRILNESGHFSGNFLTYYAYELSKSVPSSTQIADMVIFPFQKEVKAHKQIRFTANTITVKGSTTDETQFNEWLTLLKKFAWIDTFEILSFKKDKKDIQQFEIKIVINNV